MARKVVRSVAERITAPHPDSLRFLASIPLVESYAAPRMSILHVARGAFMDASSVPALVMHPIDYQSLQVAVETGRPWDAVDVQFEGLRRYLNAQIEKRAAWAVRRLGWTSDPVNGSES